MLLLDVLDVLQVQGRGRELRHPDLPLLGGHGGHDARWGALSVGHVLAIGGERVGRGRRLRKYLLQRMGLTELLCEDQLGHGPSVGVRVSVEAEHQLSATVGRSASVTWATVFWSWSIFSRRACPSRSS